MRRLGFDRRVDGSWSWVVTGAASSLLFMAYGVALSFGVFFPALATAFEADRAATSLVFSIIGGLYSTLGIVSGPAADRFGTRPVCLFGIVAMGLGLIYAGTATALWQVYLGFGAGVSLGMGCNFAPANAGLQRWVAKRRGLASGIASTGIGISILTMPAIIALMIEAQGWRASMTGLGLATLTIGGLAALLMGDPPRQPRPVLPGGSARPAAFDLRRALLSRGFVMLYLSSMFCCVGVFIPFVHLVAYAVDHGIGKQTGVYLVAVIGTFSIVGRLVLTAASDWLGRRNTLAVMYAAMGAGLLLWYAAALGDGVSIPMLALFTVLFGLGYGGYVAMVAPIVAVYFGIERIGSVLGIFMSSIAIGAAAGPWLMGYAFDHWGSYDLPIVVSGLLNLAAFVVVLWMPPRPYPETAFAGRDG